MLTREAVAKWLHYRMRMVELGLVAPSTHANQMAIGATICGGIGDIVLADLRKSDIDIWVGERLLDHAPVTVRGEVNVLRQILNWCVDEQLLGARPRLPTVQVPNVELALPEDDAYLWALKAVPENHQWALEFMMLTGLSPHEAERLQKRDWRQKASPWDGPGQVGIGMRPDFKVKTPSRRRYIPLNDRSQLLWERMTVGLRPLDAALPKGGTMQKALARARAADPDAPEDAKRITPKMMRQWFASKVANATGEDETPEHVLQRLLGHAPGSKITRKHYVRSSDAQMETSVKRLRA